MSYLRFVLVSLLTIQLHASDAEKDAFFEKHPSLKGAEQFFCKTSPMREIQFLESEKQMKFSLFAKLLELGGEVGGMKADESLSGYLERIYAGQISYFRDIEPLLREGGELYYVHLLTEDKRHEALGYIAILNGDVIYDDTFNLAAESKLQFMDLETP